MTIPKHEFSGARALIELMEIHLREFESVWNQAKAANVQLPECNDPDYNSLDTLALHVLRAAQSELLWCCQCLNLPQPVFQAVPPTEKLAADFADYLTHIIDIWRTPLADVVEEDFFRPEYKSEWGVMYCIEAMLEHAVMHPLRHKHQLQKWL